MTNPPPLSTGPTAKNLILLAVAIYATIFLMGIGAIYLFQGRVALVRALRLGDAPGLVMGYGLGAGILAAVLTILASRAFTWVRNLEDEFQKVLGRLNPWQVIALALLSGITEETLFRGAIQPFLGLIWTSLIFGLLHFPINRSYLTWTIFAIVMGILLGELYIYTGSLITPMMTHTVVNLINLYRICGRERKLKSFPMTLIGDTHHIL